MTSHPAVSRRDFLCLGAAAAALGPGLLRAADADDKPTISRIEVNCSTWIRSAVCARFSTGTVSRCSA